MSTDDRMEKQTGLVHVYYGDGSGKTTAAFGLAFRCAGRGKRVVIARFLKPGESGEVIAAERFPEITLVRGSGVRKFTFQMDDAEKARTAGDCAAIFQKAVSLARSKDVRMLVLDEVTDACRSFLPVDELTGFLDSKPEGLEVVITGHVLPEELAARADYISCVRKERHPYDRGVLARSDIEF